MSSASGLAVAVAHLELQFGGMAVLRDVSFAVARGERYGIVGPNGAGKTSLLNCISRTYRQTGGSVSALGECVDRWRPHEVARLGVARTFQNMAAFRDVSVLDFVMLGRHTRIRSSTFVCALGIPFLTGDEARQRRAAHGALDLVGLRNVAKTKIGELPYGLAKLADLARALAMEPRLLLLDEPAAGLSSDERGHVGRMLLRIRDEYEATQVVIEHDMALVNLLCQRILVLNAGQKIAEGPPQEVLGEPRVVAAFLGGRAAASEAMPERGRGGS